MYTNGSKYVLDDGREVSSKEWVQAMREKYQVSPIPLKTLNEIRVHEWANWEWCSRGQNQEGQTVLMRGRERLPNEAVKAHREFQEWLRIRRCVEVLGPSR